VVNIARGPVADQDALVDALEGDELAGAALDVLKEELFPRTRLREMNEVVVTPHAAASRPRPT